MSRAETLESLFRFSGQTVAVTGGAGALPGTMARALASLGLKIALLDVSLEKAAAVASDIEAQGGIARAYRCDVLQRESVVQAEAQLRGELGAPDYLINGAGGNVAAGSAQASFLEAAARGSQSDASGSGSRGFFDIDPADFRFVSDLNFLGTVIPTQVFAASMVARGFGAVLNIASISAITPLTKVGAYSAAKAAVASFTQWLAVHLSRTGVRVNSLAPGFIMTEQLRFLHIDPETGDYTARAREVLAHTPMGRYGKPEELIGAAVWLLSDAASFVTGSLIVADGGFSSYSI